MVPNQVLYVHLGETILKTQGCGKNRRGIPILEMIVPNQVVLTVSLYTLVFARWASGPLSERLDIFSANTSSWAMAAWSHSAVSRRSGVRPLSMFKNYG